MNKDLKIIKDKYGESMSRFCREAFPTTLEVEGLLPNLLMSHFNESHFLYSDIVNSYKINEFKDYIYSLICEEEKGFITDKTPAELFDELGYNFYECTCEDDVQKFRKYYAKGEELCTFYYHRLNTCYVFFVVKKDVDKINRNDFLNPLRQDLYGTSVMSIQFGRGSFNNLSIKNRYNHTVNNPDATYSNNLDNIALGLTHSFEITYGLNIDQSDKNLCELPSYVQASDGKYYKSNFEEYNISYCPDNTIIDNGRVIKYDKREYLLIDKFIIDLKNKRISQYRSENITARPIDSFLYEFSYISKIEVTKSGENKFIKVFYKDKPNSKKLKDATIEIDKYNRIIGYKNHYIKEINSRFLNNNDTLEYIEIPNVVEIGDSFLSNARNIKSIKLPKVKRIGNEFLSSCSEIESINLPVVTSIGDEFLSKAANLEGEISIPLVKKIGNSFLYENTRISSVNMPVLKEVGSSFLYYNTKLQEISLPSLKYIGGDFLHDNSIINKTYFPMLKKVLSNFMKCNRTLKEIDLPELLRVDDSFLADNRVLESIRAPKLQQVGYDFLRGNRALRKIDFPSLKVIYSHFIGNNKTIQSVHLPRIEYVGNSFLSWNRGLVSLNLPNVKVIGSNFLFHNKVLRRLNIPKAQNIQMYFLYYNKNLRILSLPSTTSIDKIFLPDNRIINEIYAPNIKSVPQNEKGMILKKSL